MSFNKKYKHVRLVFVSTAHIKDAFSITQHRVVKMVIFGSDNFPLILVNHY